MRLSGGLFPVQPIRMSVDQLRACPCSLRAENGGRQGVDLTRSEDEQKGSESGFLRFREVLGSGLLPHVSLVSYNCSSKFGFTSVCQVIRIGGKVV